MKKIFTIGVVCSAFSAVLFGLAGVAAAQVGADVNAEAGATVELDKATPKLQEASTKGSAGEGDPDRPTTSGRVESSSSTGGSAVSAGAVEVRGWDADQKQEFLATVKAHAEVRSEQDLENFAKGVLLRDENVEAVVANENRVEVAYRMPVRFLGVFDTSLTARAEVDAEGRVKVRYPWFGFLSAKLVTASELEADIEAALPEVGDEVLVSFEAQARTTTTVSNVMKTKHDVAVNSTSDVR